jgi:hypothetical protein
MADGRPAVGPARAQTWRCVLALAAVHAIIPPAGGVSAPGGPRRADVPGPRALQQRRAELAGAAARRDGRSHVLRARGGATQGDFGPVYDASAVGGIGISLGSRNGQLVVARLTPGWPAAVRSRQPGPALQRPTNLSPTASATDWIGLMMCPSARSPQHMRLGHENWLNGPAGGCGVRKAASSRLATLSLRSTTS